MLSSSAGFTSDLPTLGNCGGLGRRILGLADKLCFSFLIHRVLLVPLVWPVLLVQEVLVYVHGEDFCTTVREDQSTLYIKKDK